MSLDEQIEDDNAINYKNYEFCRDCDEWIHFNDFEEHTALHERVDFFGGADD